MVNQGTLWSLYDDGALAINQTAGCSLNTVQLTSNFIGVSNWAGYPSTVGRVSEFMIYQRALSASEVASVYSFRGTTSTDSLTLTKNEIIAGEKE